MVVVAALLMRGPAPASAAGEQISAATDGMRRFYLAPAVSNATLAEGGCETGYHFASFWEILDTSNLVYNTTLGTLERGQWLGPAHQLGRLGAYRLLLEQRDYAGPGQLQRLGRDDREWHHSEPALGLDRGGRHSRVGRRHSRLREPGQDLVRGGLSR